MSEVSYAHLPFDIRFAMDPARLVDATGIPCGHAGFGTDTTEMHATLGLDRFYASELGDRG